MAGFRKAESKQAYLKMALYGPPGSGKTFTTLLIAEGLAKQTGKRIAFVDTERGTDFYCQPVPGRKAHPEAFDFDAIYTRSITEIAQAVRSLRDTEYGVVVIDSVTHVWEACMLAYEGKKNRIGAIPMHAWGNIKRPYKALMQHLLSANMHVLWCGRQGTVYADDDNGEMKAVGVKMKAEGETAYEPHILIRMEAVPDGKGKKEPVITAFAEKDRTGILAGRTIQNPTFATIAAPLLGLLKGVQAVVASDEEVGSQDAEAIAEEERRAGIRSKELLREWTARFMGAKTQAEVKAAGKALTPAIKREMYADDVNALRDEFLKACDRTGASSAEPEKPPPIATPVDAAAQVSQAKPPNALHPPKANGMKAGDTPPPQKNQPRPQCISRGELTELLRLMTEADQDGEKLMAWAGVDDLAKFPTDKFSDAVLMLQRKIAKKTEQPAA